MYVHIFKEDYYSVKNAYWFRDTNKFTNEQKQQGERCENATITARNAQCVFETFHSVFHKFSLVERKSSPRQHRLLYPKSSSDQVELTEYR